MANLSVLLCWSPRKPDLDVHADLDPVDFLRTGGHSRFNVRERDLDRSITEFAGVEPNRVEPLDLIFSADLRPDHHPLGNVEGVLSRLNLLGLPDPEARRPPYVRLVNGGHFQHQWFWVERIEPVKYGWGLNSSGSADHRVFAHVRVHLLEVVGAVLSLSPAEVAAQAAPPAT